MSRYSAPATTREILDRSSSDVPVNITSGMTTQATSGDLNVAVAWVHGTRTVEVRLETLIIIQGITQAAGLKVAVATYICDQNSASTNGYYSNPYTGSIAVFGVLYHTFHDTVAALQGSAMITAIAHVEAPVGTQINLSGRAYQSLAAASTWQAVIGGNQVGVTYLPIVMTARELL